MNPDHSDKVVNYVRVAVVGHANTGKTSLIRTILRDTEFGEVADFAGTTRHVEVAELLIDGNKTIELFDTPGMEDSVALFELWHARRRDESASANQRMAAFIDELDNYDEFAQEQKVLRQAFKSDVLLYVIDAREPYLNKYRDEIKLLCATGRPIVPVLNFISADVDNKQRWREKFIEHGLHAVVEYDTVAFTMEAERRLFEKMQSLSEVHYEIFARTIEHKAQQYRDRCRAGANLIASKYIDIAAYRIVVAQDDTQTATADIQNLVRKAEQNVVDQLLKVFGFAHSDVRNEFLPVEDGRWQLDLFDSETYKQFGLTAGSNAAKGAAVGAGIDLFVGGVSLGAGAALGALAGVVWGTVQKYGGALKNKVQGSIYVCVDDATVELFYVRQRYLLKCLMSRGHATQKVVKVGNMLAVGNDPDPDSPTDATANATIDLARVTRKIRDNHKWSNLDAGLPNYFGDTDKGEAECQKALVTHLLSEA